MSRRDERRRGTARVVGLHADDGSFDSEFWRGAWRSTPTSEICLPRLNAAGAKYLLVGGYAVAFHAEPRFTKGLDVWAEPSPANAARVHEALQAFGAPLQDLTQGDLARAGLVFQIGVPPNRIDIVTAIDGVEFAEGWSGRAETTYGDQAVPVIGRTELIRNKRASGRPQDLLDLEIPERA